MSTNKPHDFFRTQYKGRWRAEHWGKGSVCPNMWKDRPADRRCVLRSCTGAGPRVPYSPEIWAAFLPTLPEAPNELEVSRADYWYYLLYQKDRAPALDLPADAGAREKTWAVVRAYQAYQAQQAQQARMASAVAKTDTPETRLRAVFDNVARQFGSRKFTAADLARIAATHAELRRALEHAGCPSSSNMIRLGWWLRQQSDAVINGFRLVNTMADYPRKRHVNVWRLAAGQNADLI